VKPALDIRGFLEDGAALNRAGKVSRRGLPKSFDGLLAASAFVERYKQTTVLLFGLPAPPRALQRLMTPILARAHARRGRSAP
jgi:pantothenate kinase